MYGSFTKLNQGADKRQKHALLSPLCSPALPAVSRPVGASGAADMSHDELAGLINSIMSLTNVAFFGLAGASLKLVRAGREGGRNAASRSSSRATRRQSQSQAVEACMYVACPTVRLLSWLVWTSRGGSSFSPGSCCCCLFRRNIIMCVLCVCVLCAVQSAIAESVWVALVVFAVRLGAIMSGSWMGCRMGGVKSETQRRCFWMSMVTQVGRWVDWWVKGCEGCVSETGGRAEEQWGGFSFTYPCGLLPPNICR